MLEVTDLKNEITFGEQVQNNQNWNGWIVGWSDFLEERNGLWARCAKLLQNPNFTWCCASENFDCNSTVKLTK